MLLKEQLSGLSKRGVAFLRRRFAASLIHCKQKKRKNNTSKGVTNLNDPLQELVVKFKLECKKPGQFIQSIRLVPDPTIVLFNEKQLSDIEHFCASSGMVDVTFNLGWFCYTVYILKLEYL